MMLEDFLMCVTIGIVGLGIGGCIGETKAVIKFEKAAIEHKAGQYNPTTGKFEWLDKSGEVQ
jgi:hypothetical protein